MLLRRSFVFNFSTVTKSQYRSKYEWIKPVGHDTGIEVYHEIAKRNVPLIFPNPNYVKWYMCGPTVYDTSHIGHASCYIKSDIIRRVLKEYYNIDPVVAIGVTDVSEKIFERSQALDQNWMSLARQYEVEFFKKMKELNILSPSLILRVTDHIPILTNFVAKLVQDGAAYKTVDGSIYFKTTAHPNYGRFKKPVADANQETVPGKLSPLDFALWKSNTLKSSKTKGLPGWHIQCSAMASYVFGSSLDIHSGGVDLIFPHHENEESQSTSYHKCEQWVNYWFHTGLLIMGDEKMSKSLKNYISISEFLEKHSSDNLRMFCMMIPYRNNSDYNDQGMNLAINLCEKVVRFLRASDCYVKGSWLVGQVQDSELLEELAKMDELIKKNLSNDFAVNEALKCVLILMRKTMKMINENPKGTTGRSPAVIATINSYVNKFFRNFGFSFAEDTSANQIPSALEAIVDAAVNFRIKIREKAHFLEKNNKKKLMNLCDEIRDNLQSIGISISDLSPSHTYWSLKSNKPSNGSTLKNVIDILVWFRSEVIKLIPAMSSDVTRHELTELCRWAKMHLSVLGVNIEDISDGRSYWSFPKADHEATSKFELMINSTLKFYADVRNVALSLNEKESVEKAKEDILALCDSATSNLKSYGLVINDLDRSDPEWLLEVTNNKGMSVVQIVMDMIMCSRDQVKSLAPLAKEESVSLKLDNICYKTKKFLTCYGFSISDSYDRNSPASWSITDTKNKVLIKNLIDVLVIFMDEIKAAAEPLRDRQMKELLLKMCDSLESDLKGIGVIIVVKDAKLTWSFKECDSVADIKQQ